MFEGFFSRRAKPSSQSQDSDEGSEGESNHSDEAGSEETPAEDAVVVELTESGVFDDAGSEEAPAEDVDIESNSTTESVPGDDAEKADFRDDAENAESGDDAEKASEEVEETSVDAEESMGDSQQNSISSGNIRARMLLLLSILSKQGVITENGKAIMKGILFNDEDRVVEIFDTTVASEKDTHPLCILNDLIEEEGARYHEELFEDCSLEQGRLVSQDERKKKGLYGRDSLTYGEIDFRSFARVLYRIAPKKGSIFYDLGSGTGKAVFLARILHDFSRCIGIELLEGLHDEAMNVKKKFEDLRFDRRLSVASDVELIHDSILDYDWRYVCVVVDQSFLN